MANNFFKIKNGAKLEPKAGSTVTVEGELAYNDTSNQLEVFGASAAESITTTTNTQTLTNKTLTAPVITSPTLTVTDSALSITDNSDATKIVKFEASGITTATTRTLTVPDADLTIVGAATTQTLTNKTLTGNTAVNLISGSGTLTLNTSGTATIPNATDTLVGKATTDTLTNKTFDADGTGNSITNIENADIKAAAAIALDKLAATTASRALVSDASGFVTPATTTSTEIGYVNGVTSAIQTQLNAKAPAASPTFTGTITTPVTASRALVTGASSELAASATTATELGYVNGVTSAIQTQLDAKVAKTLTTTTGDMIYASSANTPARLPIGTSSQILTVAGGVPSWAAAPSGGINYLSSNKDAEVDTTGWATYADAAQNTPVNGTAGSPNVTWTRTTSTPLRGSGSFLFTRDAANRQGEGVSFDFSIDQADQSQPLAISFDYKVASGTFFAADGVTAPSNDGTTTQNAGMSDLEVFIYDVTNSVLIPVTPQVLTSTSTTSANFKGRFQAASNSTSYRLILHTARSTAVAFTMQFDNFFVGPQAVNYGYAGEDFSNTRSFTTNGLGSPSTSNVYSRRNGDSLDVKGYIVAGTTTASTLYLQLPSGLAIDTTKMGSTAGSQIVGQAQFAAVATQTTYGASVFGLFYDGSTNNQIFITDQTGATDNQFDKRNASSLLSSGNLISFYFSVPIAGWSSNVQMSNDTETRVIGMGAYFTSSTAVTASNIIKYDTVDFDDAGGYSVSTGLYTIPVSGEWDISTVNQVNANSNIVTVVIDGVDSHYLHTSATNTPVSGSITLKFRAGQTVGLACNSSVTFAGIAGPARRSYWSIKRRSGPSAIAASEKVFLKYRLNAAGSVTSLTTNIDFTTKVKDSHSAWSGTVFTAPRADFYSVDAMVYYSAAIDCNIAVFIDGTIEDWLNAGGSNQIQKGSGSYYLLAGQQLSLRLTQTRTLASDSRLHWITIQSQG